MSLIPTRNTLQSLILLPLLFVLAETRMVGFHSDSLLAAEIRDLSGISSVNEFRKSVRFFASNYIGTRYRYTGVNPASGFDCSGFVHFVYKEHGVDLSRSSSSQSSHGLRTPVGSAQPGDLLFFGVKGKIHHVGIVLKNSGDELIMIHSSTSRGVIIENVWESAYWRKRLLFAKDIISDSYVVADQLKNETF